MGRVLTIAFYAVMLGAVGFFLHKVLWFFRYRRLQEKLVTRALGKLTEEADTTVVRWDQGAEVSWAEASAGDQSPRDYVRRVEDRLARLEKDLSDGHEEIRPTFVRAVMEEREPERVTLLRVPRLHEDPRPIHLDLAFPTVPDPAVPDPALFELQLRSRYGLLRRILAFFLGAADVVYSSQHVIRMSQDPKVPGGLLLRRVSLVLLILLALAVDIGFGVRDHLVRLSEQWLAARDLDDALGGSLPTALGWGIWLGCYGALYVGLYLFLRWRSGRHLEELELLRQTYQERIADIRDDHLDALARWAGDYATTLDDASMLTLHQAQMLVQRTRHRLRRRVASPPLLELAGEVARRFFERLPESSTNLQDRATAQKHSLLHAIWPRSDEMSYQVEIAQFRHAWRDIEMCLSALRGQQPDPDLAGQLWRSLVRYARMFPDIVPEDLFERLQQAHGATVSRVVEETELDLADLDDRLGELADALAHTMDSVAPLVESRVELTTQSMNASVAEFVAKALQIRERARLEAMAFEI
ncbi:MAG TPA: hypothetical protein RMH85_27025 [Polyangiaceae bacterium LLY-WYZ-15_(1-7)]|nr:hypothetical protein [Polyangiaceae bacterium LLY-WYZ-15_(1-7)]HJL00998.1 hypothetical protein [Polyangiaceae bacterium LLY-WYZ-15_(1-7)]HJL12160.1 hypothetical protein [Polyangiaceae bacterium LLY-WYZ-15_(1-7)]HJL26244.1 hypothetical protein [Polyangiaceae bacterium LLY-WYZ-15_(1-7)]HJL30655.1 hypothetical protein [Polyangiaceae bacterium LLY-WYZ-15_(1-7)]